LSSPIGRRFALSAAGDLRIILLEQQPVIEFHKDDKAGRDLVIVQLCEHGYGERALENQEKRRPTMRGFKIANRDLGQTIRELTAKLDRLKRSHDALPAKVAVRETLHGEKPQQVRVETRRLISCFRIAVFRAESALRELLRPHYRQWRQDGRTIIQSMLQSSGDLEVHQGELRVILASQSAPHRTKSLAMLCEDLNGFNTRFPGSDLRLRFSVRKEQTVS
jgi:hypothetical protein